MGQFGFVGFIAEFGLLAQPIVRAASAVKYTASPREEIFLAALALLLSINMIDLLPNSSISPWTWLLAGALLGRAEELRARLAKPSGPARALPALACCREACTSGATSYPARGIRLSEPAGAAAQPARGFLAWIERTGNRLPDPVFLFLWLILGLIVLSLVAAGMGWSVAHPTEIDEATGSARLISATSLVSPENIRRLWVEMPATFTHFHPLGYVLVVMLGAGVAERSGLFGTAMRAGVRNAPVFLLTPIVAFVGMMGNLAADAAYVVLVPLAGIIFHAAGRNPVVGIVAAFAGVSGGFSANLLPGQLDALLFGITEAAVESAFGDFTANIAGNWYFIIAMAVVFLPVIWYVTDRVIEPRLGVWNPGLAGMAGIE